MARITVEDCLKNIPNLFELVMVAAKRSRPVRIVYSPTVIGASSPGGEMTVCGESPLVSWVTWQTTTRAQWVRAS